MVAPHAGARIETLESVLYGALIASLPTRERELKLFTDWLFIGNGASLPTRERELKHHPRARHPGILASLPTRERELKHLRQSACA